MVKLLKQVSKKKISVTKLQLVLVLPVIHAKVVKIY